MNFSKVFVPTVKRYPKIRSEILLDAQSKKRQSAWIDGKQKEVVLNDCVFYSFTKIKGDLQ